MGLRGRLLATFISLSFVSLFADIVYEGARSIGGAYLNFLMAPAIAVGILGFGEFLSNLMRFLGGVLAQRMTSGKAYWSLIFIGYLVNLAIPCLAFTGAWEIAIMLFLVERVGKGLRAPARDVILSELTDEAKRGRWFGLHELLDQIGAIAGPAIIGASIYVSKPLEAGYRLAFNLLWIPVVIMIVMLLSAYMNYPRPKAVSATIEERSLKRLDKRFWSYLIGSILTLLGFIYWGVIAYYAQDAVKTGVLAAGEIPILYLIAMAVDAIIALPIGLLYDRLGLRSVALAPLTAIPITPLLFMVGGRVGLYLAAIPWGLTMGIVETIMRASVADIAPVEVRSLAYGIYSSSIGFAWFTGSLIMAYMYQVGLINMIIILTIISEATALIIYATTLR